MIILLPICEKYSSIASISLALLERYWPNHPAVRVVRAGWPSAWLEGVVAALRTCDDELFILMLDDYALCGRAKEQLIAEAAEVMRRDFAVGMIPLCWYPASQRLPRSDCASIVSLRGAPILLQASIWRRRWFLELAERVEPRASAWGFEAAATQASKRSAQSICGLDMPRPRWIGGSLVDGFDKTHWPLPYHNLMNRGEFNLRHEAFLHSEGFAFPARGLGDTVAAAARRSGVGAVVDMVSRAMGKDCGCKERRERLNQAFPY